jgi:hypothetical protein
MAKGTLKLHGFCGMMIPIAESDDLDALRSAAARFLRKRHKEFPVSILKSGYEWEIDSNDDDVMVSDYCGILQLTAPYTRVYECFECGCDVPEGEVCNCNDPFDDDELLEDYDG